MCGTACTHGLRKVLSPGQLSEAADVSERGPEWFNFTCRTPEENSFNLIPLTCVGQYT